MRRRQSRWVSTLLVYQGDIDRDGSRLSSRTKATRIAMSVASPRVPRRHGSRWVSPLVVYQGDMDRDECRLSSCTKATWITVGVVSPRIPRRHGSRWVSPLLPTKATWTGPRVTWPLRICSGTRTAHRSCSPKGEAGNRTAHWHQRCYRDCSCSCTGRNGWGPTLDFLGRILLRRRLLKIPT